MNIYPRLIIIALALMFVSCTSASTINSDGGVPEVKPREYSLSYDTVFEKAIDAVGACEWQITFADKSVGIISAKTPTSLLSWGDEVSIKVRKNDNNLIRIDVSAGTSRQMFDWGKNKGNIKKFYRKLDELILN